MIENVNFEICEICEKTSKFLLSFLYFYLNEKLVQQVCLMKYIENEISNFISHKTKSERE